MKDGSLEKEREGEEEKKAQCAKLYTQANMCEKSHALFSSVLQLAPSEHFDEVSESYFWDLGFFD